MQMLRFATVSWLMGGMLICGAAKEVPSSVFPIHFSGGRTRECPGRSWRWRWFEGGDSRLPPVVRRGGWRLQSVTLRGLGSVGSAAMPEFWRREEWASERGERQILEFLGSEGWVYFSREGDSEVGRGPRLSGGTEDGLGALGVPWFGEGFELWCGRNGLREVGAGWLYGRPVLWYERRLAGQDFQVLARDEEMGFVAMVWGKGGGVWCENLYRLEGMGDGGACVPEKFRCFAREVQGGIRRALTELVRPF